ncbi:hypothetical protein ACJMK2_002570 [Sinanodonta woodiana]|uniref:C-type lectin domain-containing protein n=1 Tax=Sinanodonta woodiana TaxID=1069815 RepID=A0ABD3XVM2_SINWO
MILRTLLVLLALLILSPWTNCFIGLPAVIYVPVPLPESGGIGHTFEVFDCQSGYSLYSANFEEFCYRFESQACKGFLDAQIDCRNEGSTIYAPSTCSYLFFKGLAASQGGACQNFWVGAQTTARGVPFQTVLGGTIPNNAPFWGPGEPSGVDGFGDVEKCATMSRAHNYFMNDDLCIYPHGFICQRFN